MNIPNHRDPRKAFDEAIADGFLNRNTNSPLYAGNWMYMHTEEGMDAFKNIITRKYIYRKLS